MQRRRFLQLTGSSAVATLLPLPNLQGQKPLSDRWGELLPQRPFGLIGNVTMLGLGGFHVGRMTDYEAEKTIETAIAGGVRFFDNAESYVSGEAEIKYGKFLTPKYRDSVFVMSKTKARDAATARKHLENSLTRMKTDYLDLWLLHQVDSVEDLNNRMKNGVYDVFLEAKKEGKVKHIGFSGHTNPDASNYLMDKIGDTMQANMLPVNLLDPSYRSFIHNTIPKLTERNLGVIAMKTLAGGAFWGGGFEGHHKDTDKVINHITIAEALHFAWSLPVGVLVSGPLTAEMFQEKIDLAKSFSYMTESHQQELISKIAHLAGNRVEYYKI